MLNMEIDYRLLGMRNDLSVDIVRYLFNEGQGDLFNSLGSERRE